MLAAAALLAALAFTGCGDSPSGEGTTTAAPQGVVNQLTRPAPGTVKYIDAQHDLKSGSNIQSAPAWLDINWASISKEGENLNFIVETVGKLPDAGQAAPLAAGEVAVLLDVNQDGTPDWGIFADYTKDGWTPGLYNMQTKQRLTGAQFTGTFTHAGTTINFILSPTAFGSPASFKWLAVTDSLIVISETQSDHAGDKLGDLPSDNSAGWPEYP